MTREMSMPLRALTIARIGAITVRIHWSCFVMVAVLLVIFSQVYTGSAGGAYSWGSALVAVLLIVASLLLHEVGHAGIARRYRINVLSIVLFAFGSATEAAEDAADPGQELLIAIAGPLVSLALVLIAALCWWGIAWAPLRLLASQLAIANGVLLVFNLLPSYPLDGGRIVRAVLWFLLDEELPAAEIGSQMGRIFGWIFLGLSVLYALSTGDILNGLWAGGLGYFLVRTAKTGYQQLALRRTLRGVKVADLMQRVYRAVAPDTRLDQFVGRYVLGQSDQGFPVLLQPDATTPQPLLGMITVRNLRRFTLQEWPFTRVGEAMTPAPHVRALAPDVPAGDALRALLESGEDQLPVIEGEALLGMLRRRDLVSYIQMRLSAHR